MFSRSNALLLGLIPVLCIAFFFAMARKPSSQKALFTVGTASGYAPFVSINQEGVYEGFDIDIASTIAQNLNKELVIQDLGSMNSLFLALEQEMIDCIIWGLSITQSRMQKVAMVPYQGETTSAYELLFWQTIPEGVMTIIDMKNKTVCVESGSSQECVLDRYPSITKINMNSVSDALLGLQQSTFDAILVEPAIARKFKEKLPSLIKSLPVTLSPEDQVFGIGIAIKKDNTALIEAVTKAVQSLKASGRIAQLQTRWEID